MSRVSLATLLALLAIALAPALPARADPLDDLEAQIARDQAALAALQDQTLSLDAQIADTQAHAGRLRALIAELNMQLAAANTRLNNEQTELDRIVAEEARVTEQLNQTQHQMETRQVQFASQLRVLDKVEQANPLKVLLTSGSFTEFMGRLSAIRQVSDATHTMAVQLREMRDRVAAYRADLDVQRSRQADMVTAIRSEKKRLDEQYALQTAAATQLAWLEAKLGIQQQQLIAEQSRLSTEIANDEAQIASILAFSAGQGGDNVVSAEYLASGWGNYYNQRDARWGMQFVGRSPYKVWAIGCLLSSTAMVYTHFGFRQVTPGTIAADPNNFTSGGLLYNRVLDVPGHPATINSYPSRSWINSYLDTGGVVTVGMFIPSGGTHFVVLTGRNGPNDYWINDPWVANAMHVTYSGSIVTGPIYTAIGYH
jgi:peptidoglycan hydrolase CwlO-like protein